jgi:hypothetical protein
MDREAEKAVVGDAGQDGGDDGAVSEREEEDFAAQVRAGVAAAHQGARGGLSLQEHPGDGKNEIVQVYIPPEASIAPFYEKTAVLLSGHKFGEELCFCKVGSQLASSQNKASGKKNPGSLEM